MFCPVCSQEQLSKDTRFCSRCGFLLVGVAQLIDTGGALPQALVKAAAPKMSRRKRGIKQGALIMLSSLVVVPLMSIITLALGIEPFLVATGAIITLWVGFLRILYAAIFESGAVEADDESLLPRFLRKKTFRDKKESLLPSPVNTADANYSPPAVNWRDTNDLNITPSVTDETTKLLSKN